MSNIYGSRETVYRWLYFYLCDIGKTLKLTLFDDEIDRHDDLETGNKYLLTDLISETIPRVRFKDVRQTMHHAVKLSFSSKIIKIEPNSHDVKEPPEVMPICDVIQSMTDTAAHIKGRVTSTVEDEIIGVRNQIKTRVVMVTDEFGSIPIRFYDEQYTNMNSSELCGKMVTIFFGITREFNGEKEVHISRFTECIIEEDLECKEKKIENVHGPGLPDRSIKYASIDRVENMSYTNGVCLLYYGQNIECSAENGSFNRYWTCRLRKSRGRTGKWQIALQHM